MTMLAVLEHPDSGPEDEFTADDVFAIFDQPDPAWVERGVETRAEQHAVMRLCACVAPDGNGATMAGSWIQSVIGRVRHVPAARRVEVLDAICAYDPGDVSQANFVLDLVARLEVTAAAEFRLVFDSYCFQTEISDTMARIGRSRRRHEPRSLTEIIEATELGLLLYRDGRRRDGTDPLMIIDNSRDAETAKRSFLYRVGLDQDAIDDLLAGRIDATAAAGSAYNLIFRGSSKNLVHYPLIPVIHAILDGAAPIPGSPHQVDDLAARWPGLTYGLDSWIEAATNRPIGGLWAPPYHGVHAWTVLLNAARRCDRRDWEDMETNFDYAEALDLIDGATHEPC